LASKEGDLILDQQKSIILKPTNFQLKALVMSSYEDASYFTEVQKALKDVLPGPIRLKIIQMRHELPAIEHFGFNKTMELIS
jgi:hypothetical protein